MPVLEWSGPPLNRMQGATHSESASLAGVGLLNWNLFIIVDGVVVPCSFGLTRVCDICHLLPFHDLEALASAIVLNAKTNPRVQH